MRGLCAFPLPLAGEGGERLTGLTLSLSKGEVRQARLTFDKLRMRRAVPLIRFAPLSTFSRKREKDKP